MKHTLPFPAIFLSLLVVILAGTSVMAVNNPPAVEKLRIFFSGNVQAELGPCG